MPEDGRRRYRSGVATKTEARRWLNENVATRLGTGAPSAEISFDASATYSSTDARDESACWAPAEAA